MILSNRFALLLMVLCLVISCCAAPALAEGEDGQTEPVLNKIADHLYETTLTEDFDWDKITTLPPLTGFACSAVQNGYFRGRNYDWNYANSDLCIVHTTVTENRFHASVGVADLGFAETEDGSLDLSRLPFITVDGINDAGVCIQVNVMPYGENGVLSHTNSSKDDLQGAGVVRLVLDYADSVESALKLLKQIDIDSAMQKAEELHWMISGPSSKEDRTIKTVIVEFFPDGMHVTEDFVDGKPIMTNFNVSNFDGTPESVGIGFGYERWQILNEDFDQACSVIGTFDLMEKVFYTTFYDLYSERFWYSEYNGTDLGMYYSEDELKSLLGEEKYNACLEKYGKVIYTAELWDGENQLHGDIDKTGIIAPVVKLANENYIAQNMENDSLWITVHTSVYDLEHLTLDIQVRESQDHLHFTID